MFFMLHIVRDPGMRINADRNTFVPDRKTGRYSQTMNNYLIIMIYGLTKYTNPVFLYIYEANTLYSIMLSIYVH